MNRKQNSLMKFSRTQRLAQLSEQEIVIEKKKREIQAKIEAQKKKETEEALRKLDSSKETKNNKPGFSRKFSWNRDDYKKNKDKDKSNESEKKDSLKNAFSNDGSFLDQFKKLSKTGLGPNNVDIQTLAMAKKKEDTEKIKNQELNQTETELNWQKKENFMKNEYRDQQTENQQSADNTLSRKPLDSNIQLQLPPPGVVQLVPQHQVQVVSLVQPVVQTPVQIVPPPVQLPSLQPMLQPLNSVPKFTTNEIQLKAISSPSFNEAPQPVPPVHVPHLQSPLENSETIQHQIDGGSSQSDFNQQSVMNQLLNIQPPLPMTPQNIPSPSPIQVQNIPPPPLPPKENNALPKIRTESISMTLKNNPVKKLELIPNPLEADEIPSPPSVEESKFNFLEQREDWKQSSTSQKFEFKAFLEKAASPERKSSRISSALYDEEDDEDQGDHVLEEKHRNLAKMVARYGDEFESSLLQRNENDPDLRFLFEKNSVIYKAYRTLIENYRSQSNVLQQEQREKFEKRSHVSDDEDEYKEKKFLKKEKMFMKQESSDSDSGTKDSSIVNRNVKDQTKSENFEKKESDGYQADNEDDVPYYKMPKSNSENDSFLPSQNSLGFKSENSKEMKKESSDESKAEEKPKRKRKSRWGDIASSSTPQTSVGPNLNLQPSKKLPTPKTNLLSQLTRSDPGLIQYAKQTFGSTNLSEEDWKKAEDHYKINLLYQDLVKKRAEIDKLEKAGKFKYEYDSDEDVEGGTWEHKLRQQEMMATQLWAEELTRQAAGKHHIGDFLPPEELKRFMEKYNAVKEGREPDLSDYKEFKLKEDNVGYRLLQKMGWNEGQGLGQDGLGITNPVNKAANRHENQGLGVERPDGLTPGDDEYDAYRKRMMLAYRFRPNPLNNPRRPYY